MSSPLTASSSPGSVNRSSLDEPSWASRSLVSRAGWPRPRMLAVSVRIAPDSPEGSAVAKNARDRLMKRADGSPKAFLTA